MNTSIKSPPGRSKLDIDLFLPNEAIQGVPLTGHAIWSVDQITHIDIEMVDSFQIEESYECSCERISDVCVRLTNFTSPGYVAFAIRSNFESESESLHEIQFRFYSGEKLEKAFEKPVCLFRPDLRLEHSPKKISIIQKSNTIVASSTIELANWGKGTCVVSFEASDDSEVSIVSALEEESFQRKFVDHIIRKLPSLVNQFPNHGEIIMGLKDVLFPESPKNLIEHAKTIDRYFEQLIEVMVEEEGLGNAISELFVQAMRSNWKIATLIDDFVSYMAELGQERVIYNNPLDIIKIPKGRSKLSFTIWHSDLAANEYPRIPISDIIIDSPEDLEVPFHTLISMRRVHD